MDYNGFHSTKWIKRDKQAQQMLCNGFNRLQQIAMVSTISEILQWTLQALISEALLEHLDVRRLVGDQ